MSRGAAEAARPWLLGCDFSSAPTRRKPIVVALGRQVDGRVHLNRLLRFETLPAFGDWLRAPANPGEGAQPWVPQAWLGGFDLPFGLPRELVVALGWPTAWLACLQHYTSLSRAEIRDCFRAFCAARPVGGKFAHRATDLPAGSSPSMKWVNPPVAYMLHAGLPLLLAAGVDLPGLHPGNPQRVALEAYPGLLAREILGRSAYKSDDPVRQTAERRAARQTLLAALTRGETRLGLALALQPAQHDALVDDASGDSLDAVLCLLQAAWAQQRREAGDPRCGLPDGMDPLEGWIITA